jgi:hypothetical protein
MTAAAEAAERHRLLGQSPAPSPANEERNDMQHTTWNMEHATHNMQHATGSMQHTAYDNPHATCNVQQRRKSHCHRVQRCHGAASHLRLRLNTLQLVLEIQVASGICCSSENKPRSER